jgi:hypothetical protein
MGGSSPLRAPRRGQPRSLPGSAGTVLRLADPLHQAESVFRKLTMLCRTHVILLGILRTAAIFPAILVRYDHAFAL